MLIPSESDVWRVINIVVIMSHICLVTSVTFCPRSFSLCMLPIGDKCGKMLI